MTAISLKEALEEIDQAIACIQENRGYDKELAKEALECLIGETLVPSILEAVEGIDDTRALIQIARFVLKQQDTSTNDR